MYSGVMNVCAPVSMWSSALYDRSGRSVSRGHSCLRASRARVLRPLSRRAKRGTKKKKNRTRGTTRQRAFSFVSRNVKTKRFSRFFSESSTHEITPLRAPTHPNLTYHSSSLKMAITYDKAMQVYFGMYAATMTTFPDEYVPPPFRPDRGRRNSRNQTRA